ncbi:flagellar hook-length control protein FliK [Desulfurivibrio dismutans]|uniref:flagellar hook-length control protein FliK n=1 Tax=Desulfurivibrio dismutans TaxID=1398908 RepID=UPI0023DCAF53|nr:flagellar hook-length control protein FliK [Desulfurivibrio alkaliphilus]MDF1613990.1 flagellar hook-length control protein FliK [Desulfurivibrio alkaliphilus]
MKIGEQTFPARPPEGRGDAQPASRSAGPAAAWEPGRLVQGRVVSAGADGRVVLELGGERVSARSSVPLTPGREFWFEVRQGGSEPRLALADNKGAMYRFLQQAAGGLGDLSRLGQLAPLVKTAGLSAEPADLLARLALGAQPAPEKLIQLASWLRPGGGVGAGGGWSWPTNVTGSAHSPATLSGQLQAMLALLRQQPPAGVDREMMAALGRVSGMLEAMAGMNEQPPSLQQSPLWLLPCFFALDAGAGSWLLSQEETGQEEGEETTILAFFLEMSRLGELQLQARLQGERLEGDFFLARPEAVAFMRGRLGDLRERLAALGYQADFRCRLSAGPLLPALKETLEKAAGGGEQRLIDLKA